MEEIEQCVLAVGGAVLEMAENEGVAVSKCVGV